MSVLITFDLDNTLWDVDPVLVRAEQAIYHWFDDRFPGFNKEFDTQTLAALRRELLQESDPLKTSLPKLRTDSYRIALEQFGLPKEEAETMSQAAFSFFDEWRQKVDLYPNAAKILWELANHYRLAVITNGTADVYHKNIGIGGSFEFVLRADQQGISKPAAGIFHKAAIQANVDVTNIIHIGDHHNDDVYGVNNVGGRSIWFNRHGARRWSKEWEGIPNAEIHALEELPNTIANLLK